MLHEESVWETTEWLLIQAGLGFHSPERVKLALELLLQIDAIGRALQNEDQSFDNDLWMISDFANRDDLMFRKETWKLVRLGEKKLRKLNELLSPT